MAAAQAAAAHAFGKIQHLFALGQHRRGIGRINTPQGRVQHLTVLGDVDDITAVHRLDALAQADVIGQLGELRQHGGIHPLAGEVQHKPCPAGRAVRKALRVGGEEVCKGDGLKAQRLGVEGGPGRAGRGVGVWGHDFGHYQREVAPRHGFWDEGPTVADRSNPTSAKSCRNAESKDLGYLGFEEGSSGVQGVRSGANTTLLT